MERPKEELESVMPKTIEWLRAIAPQQSDPVHAARILVAADTIERLQKELDLSLKAEKSAVHTAAEVIQERDAALAEVERLEARNEKQASMIRSIDPLYR